MKFCPHCGAERHGDAKFCAGCGQAFEAEGAWTQTASNNRGSTIIQAGPGAIVHPPSEPKQIAMHAKWAWNSPLTQSALAWIGVALSLASLFPFSRIIAPLMSMASGEATPPPGPASFLWFLAFALLMMFAVLAWQAARIVRRRQVRPLDRFGLLPAAWGRDGRLGLARLRGRCPECSGQLELKNIATRFGTDGKPSRWEPFCVCASNPEQHVWPFDMTATVDDSAQLS